MTDETQGAESTGDETRAPDAEAQTEAGNETTEAEENQETDADDAGEAGEGDDGEAEPPKKRTSRAEKRIKQLSREKRQEEALSAQLYADNQRLQRQLEQARSGKDAQAGADASKRPRLDDFESEEEFYDALTDWKLEQRDKAREVQAQQQKTQAEQQRPALELREKLKGHPDILEDLSELPNFQDAAIAAVNDADDPVAVSRWLGANPEKADELSRMTPTRAGREIARIEADLAKPKPNRTTKAPPPEKRVKGGGTGPVKDLYDPDLPFADYRARRMEQIRKNSG